MIRYSRSVHAALVVGLGVAVGGYIKVARTPDVEWVRVARDANYDIAIDRARIESERLAAYGKWSSVFKVWYRTDHAQPRLHNGKTFNREIVRAIVWCDSLWFKVESVDMSMGEGRTVARQRSSADDLSRQRWHRVERGTTEEIAALAACHFGRQAVGPETASGTP
jgi:hypothetical protein